MEKIYNVGIIQTTRIGDILQTTLAAQVLKNENPNTRMTLICRKKFGKNIEFLLRKTFDDIIFLDTKTFLSNEHDRLSGIKEKLENFLKNCNSYEFDFLFNLSFNKSSSYLTALIDANQKFGLQRNEFDQIVIKDQTSQLVYSSVMGSTLTPFNLVDLFRNTMGVNSLPYLPITNLKKKKTIVIHPFASHTRKRLPVSKWAEIIYQTLKKNLSHELYIVGSDEDRADTEKLLALPIVKAYSERIKSLVGEANIETVYNHLSDTSLFIGHDSMVSHLTSFHQTPSIIISLGTVRPMETSPYNESAYILSSKAKCSPCNPATECAVLSCHADIHPSIVSQIASAVINEEVVDEKFVKNNLNIFQLNQCQISKTFIQPQIGLLLGTLTNDYQSMDDVFRVFYGVLWSYFFKEIDFPAETPKITAQTANALSSYKTGIEQLFELYGYGAAFSKRIIDDTKKDKIDISAVQDSVKKITNLDQLITIIKQQYKNLSPLIDFINTMKLNSAGESITQVAEGNLISFHDGKILLSVMQELLNQAIDNVPKNKNNREIKEV